MGDPVAYHSEDDEARPAAPPAAPPAALSAAASPTAAPTRPTRGRQCMLAAEQARTAAVRAQRMAGAAASFSLRAQRMAGAAASSSAARAAESASGSLKRPRSPTLPRTVEQQKLSLSSSSSSSSSSAAAATASERAPAASSLSAIAAGASGSGGGDRLLTHRQGNPLREASLAAGRRAGVGV
jgi:hypothetical protein